MHIVHRFNVPINECVRISITKMSTEPNSTRLLYSREEHTSAAKISKLSKYAYFSYKLVFTSILPALQSSSFILPYWFYLSNIYLSIPV